MSLPLALLVGWLISQKEEPVAGVTLESTVTCPYCGFATTETMPSDA